MAENLRRSEAVSSKNARKTHCHRGHPFIGRNSRGRRYCEPCSKPSERR